MSTTQASKEEMLKRVARFKELKPTTQAFLDTVIPGHERELLQIIGRGVIEDPNAVGPVITNPHDFNIGINKHEPGKRVALHAHPTVEVFMPLNGEWAIYWGDEGENEIILGPWDTMSIPTGIMRAFKNISNEVAHLLVTLGAPGGDAGHVDWPAEVLEETRQRGLERDKQGKLITKG